MSVLGIFFADGHIEEGATMTSNDNPWGANVDNPKTRVFENVVSYHSGISNYRIWMNTAVTSEHRAINFIPITADTTIDVWMGCILKGANVTLADGTVKNIEDIEYTDELSVWDFDNGVKAKSAPCWIKKRQETTYLFVCRFANGKELKITGKSRTGWGHRGYNVTRGRFTYFPASVGDDFMMEDGTVSTLVSCERKEETCEFYNVITKEHFNLYANGVLTSCSLNNCYPIVNGHRFHVYENPFACTREDFAKLDDEFGKALVDRYYKDMRLGEQRLTLPLIEYVRNLMLNRKEAN